ncbi:DUF5050 domain-containing protein [Tissierella sp. Yu-01]|uniref:DUF5050 domain-containing protein n=1 Tax=Tissierella sp. Yu-01 TaxID=3035694 RepID=UPI00240D8764|nr:DUF5050 domain-containing protein [Tissierella sp. Yu-01]WFA08897.1 DUF5050 domain-containing protein [Tissierella sp. Yu-01]
MKILRNNRQYIFIILIFVVFIVILESDIIEKVSLKSEQYQLNNVKNIRIDDNYIHGNSESNINNYGLVAESEEFVFYIDETSIYRSNREFKDEVLLIKEPQNKGKDSLNIVGEWVFFRQGKEIKRMKYNGENVDRIFKGYSLHMDVIGDRVYFVNVSDDSKIYKMDVNGENREVLMDKHINDMAIYDDKIYYSYEYNEEYYLEKMSLDGSEKEFITNLKTRNMVVDGGYIYYIDDVDENLYSFDMQRNSIELLSDKQILKFAIDDSSWIFYTLKAEENSRSRFKGLYRMDTDGENILSLDSEAYLSEVGIGITDDWIFYRSWYGNELPVLRRISKDGTESMIMRLKD